MIFKLIILGLLAAVAIRQATQGFFSALISCILAVCCATAALGTYEWVAVHWVAPYLDPNYAMPVALGVVFGVPFTILQVVFGQLVKRAGLLPALVEKIGGGICGFVTAMVTIGILALAIQMLPFDYGKILGFASITVADPSNPETVEKVGEQSGLYLNPDRFTVALASVLSNGVFSGKEGLATYDPDLVQEIGWVGAVPSMVSRFAQPNSIRIDTTAIVPFVYQMTPGNDRTGAQATYEPLQPDGGEDFWMIRVRLMDEARDKTKSHIFTLRQFRLVGTPRGDDTPIQYHPIAIQQADASQPVNRHVRLVKSGAKFVPQTDTPFSPRRNSDKVEIVFELPKGFQASFLEYKHGARVAVKLEDKSSSEKVTEAAPAAPQAPATPANTTASKTANPVSEPPASRGGNHRIRRGSRVAARGGNTETKAAEPPSTAPQNPPDNKPSSSGGNVRGVGANQSGSKFGDDLPLVITSYQQNNADLSGGVLRSGRLIAEIENQTGGTEPRIAKFFVPDDKRLLQLSVGRLQARSGLGRALSFAVTTVQNYFVQDTHGNRYQLAGKYAIAKVNDKDVFEVQYFSGPVGSIGGIGKFTRINESKLKQTDTFVLLFLVDPGVTIKSFSTGGAATREDDLRRDNLVAPN